jgi:hypothetical protein
MQDAELRRAAEVEYEEERIIRLLHEDSELNRKLGQALVERAIIGDIDENPDNFVLGDDDMLQTTDLDYAFSSMETPVWIWGPQKGIINRVFESFSGKRIPEVILRRVEEFLRAVEQYHMFDRLQELGVPPERISSLFARARWFVKNKTYPRYQSREEVLR